MHKKYAASVHYKYHSDGKLFLEKMSVLNVIMRLNA
jgi:hypothetical protein